MNGNLIIKNIYSGFLICILALSLTPRIVLHNLVSKHKDKAVAAQPNGKRIAREHLICQFDQLEANAPFISSWLHFACPTPEKKSTKFVPPYVPFGCKNYFFSGQRGPSIRLPYVFGIMLTSFQQLAIGLDRIFNLSFRRPLTRSDEI